jgi:hypothetical protein
VKAASNLPAAVWPAVLSVHMTRYSHAIYAELIYSLFYERVNRSRAVTTRIYMPCTIAVAFFHSSVAFATLFP